MLLSQLKDKIAQEMLPSIEQRIYFNGMLMDKEQTLREYGIKEKSSIYLNTEDVKGEYPLINSFLEYCHMYAIG